MFSDDPSFIESELKEPKLIEARRGLRLKQLELECALLEKVEKLEELYARECWFACELMKHVPEKELTRAMVDREVNTLDPDFSFRRMLDEREAREREEEKSST